MRQSVRLTRGMSVKTVTGWLAVAFVIWWVIEQPAGAAHVVHNIGVFLSAAAAGLSAFFASLPSWMAVVVPLLIVVLAILPIVIRGIAQSARRRWNASTVSLLGNLARFSALIAGGQRPHVREEWQGNIVYSITAADGSQSTRHILRYAIGLIIAAIRYRARDVADLIWRPIDVILASRKLSNLAISIPLLAAVMIVVHRSGVEGLVSNADNLVAIGCVFYGAIRAGRRWRGVKPAKHKPSNARK
jgi:hypothetical protein